MRYVILGGGGVFGIQAASYLLELVEAVEVLPVKLLEEGYRGLLDELVFRVASGLRWVHTASSPASKSRSETSIWPEMRRGSNRSLCFLRISFC